MTLSAANVSSLPLPVVNLCRMIVCVSSCTARAQPGRVFCTCMYANVHVHESGESVTAVMVFLTLGGGMGMRLSLNQSGPKLWQQCCCRAHSFDLHSDPTPCLRWMR